MRNKLIVVTILLFISIVFSGCVDGNGGTDTTTSTTATTTTTTLQKTPPPMSSPDELPGTGVVTGAWLKDHLDEVTVLYVGQKTNDKSNYEIAHIRGAAYLNARELCRPANFTYLGVKREVNCCVFGDPNSLCAEAPINNGFNYQVSTKEQFEKLAGELGITRDRPVVVYGSPTDPYVARTFWNFDYYGQWVYYLDGGNPAWWYGRTNELTKITPTNYTVSENLDVRATADYVNSKLNDSNTVIVDTRNIPEYKGELVLGANLRGGHIPGGVLLDWKPTNLNSDGTFKSVEELREIYGAAGVTSDKEIITHCEGGVRSSHTYIVLKYILGYPNVRNFEASWNEWGNARNPDETYKYPIEK